MTIFEKCQKCFKSSYFYEKESWAYFCKNGNFFCVECLREMEKAHPHLMAEEASFVGSVLCSNCFGWLAGCKNKDDYECKCALNMQEEEK